MFINRKSRVSSSVIAFRSIPRAAGHRHPRQVSHSREPSTSSRDLPAPSLAARSSRSERTRRERKQRGNNFPLLSRVRSPASRARRLDASFTLQPCHRSRPGRREDGCLIVRHPTRTARVVPRRRRDVRTGRPVEKEFVYIPWRPGSRWKSSQRRTWWYVERVMH